MLYYSNFEAQKRRFVTTRRLPNTWPRQASGTVAQLPAYYPFTPFTSVRVETPVESEDLDRSSHRSTAGVSARLQMWFGQSSQDHQKSIVLDVQTGQRPRVEGRPS